ncbi:glutathione S-transferase [Sinorhizobium fredii USDA 205]|uniref:Glutathione S-transferase n=1 Tax=Rhizobium fredii TaxID=380 RepID=A0A844A9E2_RHIFR|nr:glutathione S-transferase [Sinorhizobium fredii]ASY72063.1 Glutathione S-transferase [Sinorhizobium fredii CCBAU 83666]KSV84309.1 glutathione S-transferase [Sinorhizobium fredii USDA 205]MQX08120.1 glutathione S-transferase [Sinorhizobium fredii]GEC30840.1 glutathione S-transferase [Sinorhizobium fredii]GLS10391.1 glutathione S-transferase [Sinorhizobium fredii]
MQLYYHPLSGHAHRARLLLSLLGLEHDLVLVDLARREHKQEPFLKLNPFGQVPVLDDGGTIICDSNAILVYLAKTTGRADWLPEDPQGAAAVQRWLTVAAGQIAHGPAQARLINVFKAPYRPEEVIPRSHAILTLIEAALEGRGWIATDRPTIADVALYSYVARAPEGDVDLQPYANIRAWLERIEALPGFVDFQKTPVGLDA